MRMTRSDFLQWPHKAITLLGMSGVGKTTLAYKLPRSKWFHYSGDYRIGTKYLDEPILDNIKRQAMKVDFLRDLLRSDSIYIASNITVHNLEPVATFLGKIGRTDRGGLPVTEFKKRQKLHRDAEIGAMRDVESFIVKAQEIYGYDHFINDAGGSLVELEDERTIQTLADNTLILYLKPDPQTERALVQRAIDDPKPLYYQESFLDAEARRIPRRSRARHAGADRSGRLRAVDFSRARRAPAAALRGARREARLHAQRAARGSDRRRARLPRVRRERAGLTHAAAQPAAASAHTHAATTLAIATAAHTACRRRERSHSMCAQRASASPPPKPAMKPKRCAVRSVFSPAVPVNASNPMPATIGAIRPRHGVSRKKPRRHV